MSTENFHFYIKVRTELNITPSAIHNELSAVYGDQAPSLRTIQRWSKSFREGREEIEDEVRPGRPITETTVENIEQVRLLIDHDPYITIEEGEDEGEGEDDNGIFILNSNKSMVETATFSLGCFWDPDARFGVLDGVLITRVGYCGGTHPTTPTYKSIGDYTESVQIDFDSTRISFTQLLSFFNQWHIPNTSKTRSQYAAAIFYHSEEQQRQVKKMNIENVRIDMFNRFYEAEDYHQKYNLKRTIMETDIFGKKEDWTNKDKQMLTKLNGFLAGYGTLEQFQQWDKRQELTREQQNYIKDKLRQ